MEQERDEADRSQGRRVGLRNWLWLWCAAGAGSAAAVGGTAGWVVLALAATGGLFLYAVIARIEGPPPPPRSIPPPDPATAPLVLVARGRTDLFATWRIGSMIHVQLIGDHTWTLPDLEWHRTYAVRIPPGHYRLRLFDHRGKGAGNTEEIDVTLVAGRRVHVEYRRGGLLLPRATLRSQPAVPDDAVVDQVIRPKREPKR